MGRHRAHVCSAEAFSGSNDLKDALGREVFQRLHQLDVQDVDEINPVLWNGNAVPYSALRFSGALMSLADRITVCSVAQYFLRGLHCQGPFGVDVVFCLPKRCTC